MTTRAMQRDSFRFSQGADSSQVAQEEHFDVVVIGGGINGAACAWEAALRGYKTALVERGDFGAATSAGCFKIAHGGLRYLQHLNFSRMRESVAEQRTLRQIAPHLVHPLPFLVPTSGFGMKSSLVLRTGLSLYERLTQDRNIGVGAGHELPDHRVLNREEVLRVAPGLAESSINGGVVFYDCQMSNCDRLTLAVIKAAQVAGARLANYAELTSVKTAKNESTPASDRSRSVTELEIRDVLSGKVHCLRTKFLINAAGPWVKPIASLIGAGEAPPLRFSKGIQLVMRQFVSDYALAVESTHRDRGAIISRGGRSFFVHPWRGRSLVGTSDSLYEGDPDNFRISLEEIRELLLELRSAYKDDAISPAQVEFAFGGLRPLAPRFEESSSASAALSDGDAKVATKEQFIEHWREKAAGQNTRDRVILDRAISVVGVKYTTFRALGEEVVNRMTARLQALGENVPAEAKRSATSRTALPGGDIESFESFLTEQVKRHPNLPESVIRTLAENYGTELDALSYLVQQSSSHARSLAENCDTIEAEIIFACRNEMCSTFEDVVMRRTGLGTLGFPGEPALRRALQLVAAEFAWDKARAEEEYHAVLANFQFPSTADALNSPSRKHAGNKQTVNKQTG